MRFQHLLLAATVAALTLSASAFPSIPKPSARALGVTRGKSFTSGLVFINGKYLPPPYVVERWGTGLRINGRKISGQVIDWSEFLKTQDGVQVTRTAAPAPVAAAPTVEKSEDETSLDDLFNDVESGSQKKGAKKGAKMPRKRAQPSVTYSFDGEFKANATTKALVEKINAARTDIDKKLRLGAFFFFGDGYSRVTGDAGTAWKILEKLPEAQKASETQDDFCAALRTAGLVFLPDALCQDLYRNRVDYRSLMDRRENWKLEAQIERKIQ